MLYYSGGSKTEDIPVTTGAAAVEENDLVSGTGDAVPTTDGKGNYNYVLDNVDDVIGFYKANDLTVPQNRAYLQTTYNVAGNSARSMRIVFDGITGVNNFEAIIEATAKKNGTYLENGKIVIYKNDMKFNAAGAKLY